jgi:hypothetical protein
VEENTVPSLRRERDAVCPHVPVLVQAGFGLNERIFGALRQISIRGAAVATIRVEARGAHWDDPGWHDGGSRGASRGDGSNEGDNGFLEEHC